jgi:hypothetical protein
MMNGIANKEAGADACAGLAPAEFVRLRYFFGQRLGVVDLADEQAYFAGKQRFHNLRAHGDGVLCGLQATRFVFPQNAAPGTTTTVLRVSKGAALDGAGREIVVGWDQCVDVAQWLAHHASAIPASGGELPLWVALYYRECPSEPALAPRDPCGCDPGGCEFARVREGFELRLVTAAEAEKLAHQPKQPRLKLSPQDLHSGSIEAALEAEATRLAGAPCHEASHDPGLLLASFKAKLSADRKSVVDIDEPDNLLPSRRSLLSTAELQAWLLEALAGAAEGGLLGAGPKLQELSFKGTAADAGVLSIALAPDEDLSRHPFDAPAQLTVKVSQFKDDGSWAAADPASVDYISASPRHFELAWTAGLTDGGRYRVVFIVEDPTQPVVDKRMQPLTPSVWTRHFRLVKDASGTLSLAGSLY